MRTKIQGRLSKKEADDMTKVASKAFGGLKTYGKNVVGGAKIVGGALKKAAQWPGKQVEKEFRNQDAKNKVYKAEGKALTKAYSARR
jgi:hypothetical protein